VAGGRSRAQGAGDASAARAAALLRLADDWNVAELHDSIGAQKKLFVEACGDQQRCLTGDAFRVLFTMAMELSNLATSMRVGDDRAALRDSVSACVTTTWLYHRLLRCRVKVGRNDEFFALHLGPLAFAACAAICIGAESEARWMAAQYVRHLDAGKQCQVTQDTAFLAASAWVCRWYLGAKPATAPADLGGYRALLQGVLDGADASAPIAATLDERVANAHRLLIAGDVSHQFFYGDPYGALFPFEVLAVARVLDGQQGPAAAIHHPLLDGLWPDIRDAGSWRDAFAAEAAESLTGLERSVGITWTPASP